MWQEAYKKKLIDPSCIEEALKEVRKTHHTLVTLNGSFDLLHAGHLQIIYEASLQGDCLIVALNSDRSIKRYKGEDRPIIPLEYRLQMMAAFEFVDFVTYFDESDPCALLRKISPNVHVNGSEYGKDCIEALVVKQCGGRLHLVDRIEGLSTSKVIEHAARCKV